MESVNGDYSILKETGRLGRQLEGYTGHSGKRQRF